jgi:hypothetical protein
MCLGLSGGGSGRGVSWLWRVEIGQVLRREGQLIGDKWRMAFADVHTDSQVNCMIKHIILEKRIERATHTQKEAWKAGDRRRKTVCCCCAQHNTNIEQSKASAVFLR